MNTILNISAVVNGIYDILCALSILSLIYIPIINELHISMIKDVERNNQLMKRFMAYWIFSYGVMRIYGGYNMNYKLIAISYYIEALVLSYENFVYKTLVFHKAMFVIAFSLFLGILFDLSYRIE
jgi:hypothetical protein